MSHEIFAIERKPAHLDADSKRIAYIKEKIDLARSLGLYAQVKQLITALSELEKGGLIDTPPMSEAEKLIWGAWLPTVYSDSSWIPKSKLADYNFDRIPQPVLKQWKKHRDSGLFDEFEIWAPEVQQPDPVLVGVIGSRRYLLARWGESDANLVSFDDIKKILVHRWHKGERIGRSRRGDHSLDRNQRLVISLIASIGIFIAITFVSEWCGKYVLHLDMNQCNDMVFVVGKVLATSFLASIFHRRLTQWTIKKNPVMRAIDSIGSIKRTLEINPV